MVSGDEDVWNQNAHMTQSSQANLLVFRDAKTQLATRAFVYQLSEILARDLTDKQNLLDAVIRAGELECALADSGCSGSEAVAELTDRLAVLLVDPSFVSTVERFAHIQTLLRELLGKITQFELPATLTLSPLEGFAYYALHPLDFADIAFQLVPDSSVAVIGIRSIGTVLSAVFAAGLKVHGHEVSRITVRPTGHPYSRRTEFLPSQLQWIREHQRRGSQFFVVDEGPGLSGSSFLSVGEALLAQGIPSDRITLIGTRLPDPSTLCAPNAAERWNRLRHDTVKPNFYGRLPQEIPLSGGAWRNVFLTADRDWPACWPEMERLKFLSRDGKSLWKFDGLGRFGQEVRERADCLARAGFSPSVENAGNGLNAYALVAGTPLARADVSASIIERMAQYCAFRAGEFGSPQGSQNGIAEMVQHNLQQELNLSIELDTDFFCTSARVVADGHMQPEEWIAIPQNEILKVDACTHGDDHFLPGPVDIAWDFAGAIVEWDLNPDAQELLVGRFHHLSGDNPRKRLPAFLVAYSVFRLSYCKMAGLALRGSSEEFRWRKAYRFYRQRLDRELQNCAHFIPSTDTASGARELG